MNFDDLLRSSAEHPSLPPHFVQNVQARVQALQRRALLRDALALSGALILFFYELAWVLTTFIAEQTGDFLSVAMLDPTMLSLEEGRSALLETLPLWAMLLTVMTIGLSAWLLRQLYKDIAASSPLFLQQHGLS